MGNSPSVGTAQVAVGFAHDAGVKRGPFQLSSREPHRDTKRVSNTLLHQLLVGVDAVAAFGIAGRREFPQRIQSALYTDSGILQ